MSFFTKWMGKIGSLDIQIQDKLLASAFIILILWLISMLIYKVVLHRIKDLQLRYRLKKTVTYVISLVGILMVGLVWFEEFQSITTFLGLFSAGLAIALKDLVINIAGWVFIIWRRPFEVGDRVQIGDHAGDVIDLRIFQFTLLEIGNWVDGEQSTGRIIHIPNGRVFSYTQANYSKGFQYIWNEIPVLLTFESDWKKAKMILQKIANKHAEHLTKEAEESVKKASRKFMIFYSRLTPTVYTNVKDSGVMLTIRYLCKPRHRRGSTQDIWEDILEEFASCDDIDLAYPTRRIISQ